LACLRLSGWHSRHWRRAIWRSSIGRKHSASADCRLRQRPR
jgi:hypothetical protein